MNTMLHTLWSRLGNAVGRPKAAVSFVVLSALAVLVPISVDAVPVGVRFPEGVTHGFLLVRSLAGEILGQGELTQVVKEGDLVESQLVFRFKDGSLHDEKVAYSQQRVFTLIRYRLIQRGPSFPEQLDATIDRGTGEYTVRSKTGEDGKETVLTGQVDLPKDVYSGMLITVSKNLPKGTDETVSVLAFTPAPEVVNVQLHANAEQPVNIGALSLNATQYAFTPQIGRIRKWFGKVTGKLPAQFHYNCWILVDEAPSFVQFEGPLQLMGPILRIELMSPRLPAKPDDRKMLSP